MGEYSYPTEVVQTNNLAEEKDDLLREMSILLSVAIKEWPRQVSGTTWETQAKAILKRYRKLQ